jgi:tripartite-type tricarboxylate transporter receptor subunit TctC
VALALALPLLVLSVGSPDLRAQTQGPAWPTRSVRLVVPYPAGGTTDVLARALAERFQQAWGQPVVVDNRSGAAGLIGTQFVAQAVPDGHVLVVGNNSTHAANAALFGAGAGDPVHDFVAVAFLASSRHALVVPASSSAHDLAGLIALGRSRRLAFGSSSVGSASHLIGETLRARAGLDAVHVPYRGVGPAVTDLLGGQLDFMAATWASVSQSVDAGRLRALAIGGTRREATAASAAVASFAEQGWPDLDLDAWFALFAPAGTPPSVVTRLHAEAGAMLADPAVVERLRGIGFEPRAMSLEATDRFFRREVRRWAEIVRVAGVRLEAGGKP